MNSSELRAKLTKCENEKSEIEKYIASLDQNKLCDRIESAECRRELWGIEQQIEWINRMIAGTEQAPTEASLRNMEYALSDRYDND